MKHVSSVKKGVNTCLAKSVWYKANCLLHAPFFNPLCASYICWEITDTDILSWSLACFDSYNILYTAY